MKKRSETTPMQDGWVKRDTNSGRLIEVGTKEGVAKATSRTETAVREASSKRGSALKRLADR